MIIVVEGHDVEVDDSFAKLSSAEQEKTVNEIAASLKLSNPAATSDKSPEAQMARLGERMAAATTPAVEAVQQVVTTPEIASAAIAPAVRSMPGPNIAPSQPGSPWSQVVKAWIAGEAPQPSSALGNIVKTLGGQAPTTPVSPASIPKPEPYYRPGPVPTAIQKGADIARTLLTQGNIANLISPFKEGIVPGIVDLASKTGLAKVTPSQAVGAAGRFAGGMLTAPENLMLAPYQMAAREAQQIRANPEAPGLERQPYAMTVRGEMPTQGAAAAANVRRGIVNRPFGNVAPEERALLEEERQRKLKNAIQLEAASRIRSTGGLQNYIRNWPGGTQ